MSGAVREWEVAVGNGSRVSKEPGHISFVFEQGGNVSPPYLAGAGRSWLFLGTWNLRPDDFLSSAEDRLLLNQPKAVASETGCPL